MSIMNGNYNFILNNIKETKAFEKRLKLFEYPRNKTINSFIFLQETHSPSNDEQKQKDDFKVPLFFHTKKAILVV